MNISGDMIPKISSLVKVRDEEFGLLLVSKKTPILALNEDSKIIWNSIDNMSTVSQIVDKIQEEIGGEVTDIDEVVKSFIDGCYKLRIIEL